VSAARTGTFGAFEAKGDVLVFDGADVLRLPVGAEGRVPVADPNAAAGLKYLLPPSATGYVSGCRVAYVAAGQVSIGAGVARSSDDLFDIRPAGTLTTDITVAGAGGLDTGAEAAGTWYAHYLIADSTGVNAVSTLLSVSFVAPVMPAGYNRRRRVGCVRNDAALNFIPFVQVRGGENRCYYLDLTPATAKVLTGGAAAAFTDVSLAAFVPPSASNALLLLEFAAGVLGALGDELRVRPDGFAASAVTAPIVLRAVVTVATMVTEECACACPGQIIEYRVSDAANNTADISVIGFDDEL
jgi:hypothetical protein